MDGRMNCHLTAENAAFTKLRHLENRVVETETRLDVLEQETTQLDEALQNALTSLGEKVETESVDTTSLNADTVDATHIEADSITTPELTATTIEAESIDVDNLENVNVLHGKTVDVEKTIATIGQFTETQTTTANNSTTNTEELNVSNEANLTGQVNIDGDMTFTKDNGLSKLQGNYLEIDAANVVIDNKNDAEYALYVPGINGDALFGGSVAVQDTLATKNLMVTEEAHFSNLTLNENTVLDNPTLENIAQTQELTDKALDIDENGKLVRKFVAGGSAGTVANALIANETRYVSELNPILQRAEDDINYVFQVDTNTFIPMVYDEERPDEPLAAIPNGDAADPFLTCSHLDNIYYIKGSEYLKYNITTGATTVVAQIDESKTYVTMSIFFGKVLNEDIPVYYCANDNKMYSLLDGSELEVSFNSDEEVLTVYADKNGKTYKGIISTDTSFNSILDEGQGVLFEVPDRPDDDGKGYAVNCPAAILDMDNDRMGVINGGQQVDVEGEALFYRLVKDGTYIYSAMGLVYTYNESDTYAVLQPSTVYNYGYFAGFDYITNTPHQVEKVKIDRTQADFTDVPVTADTITADTITINDKATIKDIETSTIETSTIDAEVVKTIDAEVDGMTFYRGKWYDKVFSSAKPLVDYILDTTDKSPYQTYNILFTGNVLDFRAADLPNTTITSSQVIGTYKVYSDSNDDVRELNFVEAGYDPLAIGFRLFNSIYFYGFETQLDVASKDSTKCLHLNNCTLHFKDNYGASTSVGTFKLNKCNNVSITATDINWSSFPGAQWENCNNVQLRYWGFIQGGTYSSMNIWMVDCNDCYIAVPPINIKTVSFGQVGKGNNLVVHFQSEYGTKKEPTYTTAIQ